ncbi:MAG: polyamine aminopropyltransferase, partial [Ruminococcus sp.]|nr:polyamine aminopropyltransferase [Ruminococcus sp.]
IGAGDGGTVRELTKYGSIGHIDMVEIDEEVVNVCKEYLPRTACKLTDERVSLYFEDGLKFVRTRENAYDLIIVDSTDPFGPGEGLFTSEFYGNCFNALTANGILVNQHESPYYAEDAKAMQRAHKRIREFFPICRVYQVHIPTYPSGHWLFGFASKSVDPLKPHADRWNSLGIKTRYYNTDLHTGCFAIPTYVKELLDES